MCACLESGKKSWQPWAGKEIPIRKLHAYVLEESKDEVLPKSKQARLEHGWMQRSSSGTRQEIGLLTMGWVIIF